MVLTRRVGKKRPFWRGLVLTVVTIGVYAYYWAYKAHTELFRQYELDREARDDGVPWLIVGVFIPFLLLVYYWKFVENVRYVRARMRLPDGITPARFVGFHVAAGVITFITLMLAVGVLFTVESTAGEAAAAGAMGAAGGLYVLGLLLGTLLLAVAFHALQRDVNGTWDWFDAHVRALTETRPPTAAPPADPGEGTFDPPV